MNDERLRSSSEAFFLCRTGNEKGCVGYSAAFVSLYGYYLLRFRISFRTATVISAIPLNPK